MEGNQYCIGARAGRLGGDPRCQKSGGKPWPGSLRSDFSLVWGIPGSQLCAGVLLGAVRERFGDLSELGNRLSGSFRSSEIGSQSPLIDHFGGMFDFKAGRWHCGAHVMAENTESHETCSTLSTNALDVRILFPGSAHVASGQEIRRPWRGVWGGASDGV